MQESTVGFARIGKTWPIRHDTRTLSAIEDRLVRLILNLQSELLSSEARLIADHILRQFWVIPKE